MPDILEGLTDAQRQAVTHINGPLLVVAGPGSGKTRVITRRIAHLLYCGIKPWNILAITFTNKAANEMRERVAALGAQEGVWLSTFHSYCARVLRQYADRMGFRKDFTIYDDDDSARLIQQLMKEGAIDKERVTPRIIQTLIGAAKERLVAPEEYEAAPSDPAQKAAAQVYAGYQARLAAANAMDFDDLVMKTALLLRQHADVLEQLRRRHQFVLIDEFQDTSRSQYMIAGLLTREHRNICATGDPDQSIYGWRGADIHNILDFERDYPEAKVVFLDRNYRSTKTILAAADQLIAANTERKERTLYTNNPAGEKIRLIQSDNPNEEAGCVAGIVGQLIEDGFAARDIAVFYRVNWLSRPIEEAFLKGGIPYQVVGGVAFYARKEVKDILAYLRLASNPGDEAAFRRIINVPPRGAGPKTLAALGAWAREHNATLIDALKSGQARALVPEKKLAVIDSFLALLSKISAAGDKSANSAAQVAIGQTGYVEMLKAAGRGENHDRIANLDELANAAAGYDEGNPEGKLAGFLEETALVADIDNWKDREDRVTLMTMHAAKGLEFPAVLMLGLEEGILPHMYAKSASELEEERRVFFVAMTRAMRKLYLFYSNERLLQGSWRYNIPSRFLKGIPRELVEIESPAVSFRERPLQYRVKRQEHQDKSASPLTLGPNAPKPGMRVRHGEFGHGVIKSVVRQGQRHKITVTFGGAVDRKLIYELAHLEVISQA